MQKKEILTCLVLALIFLSLVFGFWLFKRHEAAKQGQLHVFVEFTTNGALLEMVEFVKLPADVPKIIAWGRFQNVKDRVDLSKYNAREIKCNTADIVREVKKELRKHPNYKIVFYTTIDHAGVSLFPLLEEIPSKNVAHIHFFEEGHGALAIHKKAYHLAHDYEFDNCPDNPILPTYAYYSTKMSLDEAKAAFERVKELSIKLSMIENSAIRLASNIKKTQKRANALKNITIPTYTGLVYKISNELEEKEREEFTRLKVIKRMKQKG